MDISRTEFIYFYFGTIFLFHLYFSFQFICLEREIIKIIATKGYICRATSKCLLTQRKMLWKLVLPIKIQNVDEKKKRFFRLKTGKNVVELLHKIVKPLSLAPGICQISLDYFSRHSTALSVRRNWSMDKMAWCYEWPEHFFLWLKFAWMGAGKIRNWWTRKMESSELKWLHAPCAFIYSCQSIRKLNANGWLLNGIFELIIQKHSASHRLH